MLTHMSGESCTVQKGVARYLPFEICAVPLHVVPSSFLLLVVRPGAPSSVLLHELKTRPDQLTHHLTGLTGPFSVPRGFEICGSEQEINTGRTT